MTRRPWGRRLAASAAIVGLVAIAAACGSDDDSSSDDTSGAVTPRTTPTPDTGQGKECSGAPLKFTTIMSLSGPVAPLLSGIEDGIKAGEAGVNADCTLGRPMAINICDDKSDPNGAAACGRTAADDGSIAVIGHVGAFDQGVATAQLPVLADGGGAGYMLTSPIAFSPTGSVSIIYGTANVAKAAGAKDVLWVGADLDYTHLLGSIIESGAKAAGVGYDAIYFPATTTDYASVAAQIASKKASAIAYVVQEPLPLLKALDAEGVRSSNTVLIGASPLSDDQIKQLGPLAEGIIGFGSAWPYSDTSNPGVAKMHEEFAAAGIDDSKENVLGVSVWAQVHIVADVLGKMTPEQQDAMESDPQAFVDALVAASPFERAELAPFDISKPAWTPEENATLAQFRPYSRSGLVTLIRGGKTVVITDGFADFSKPLQLSGI